MAGYIVTSCAYSSEGWLRESALEPYSLILLLNCTCRGPCRCTNTECEWSGCNQEGFLRKLNNQGIYVNLKEVLAASWKVCRYEKGGYAVEKLQRYEGGSTQEKTSCPGMPPMNDIH